jgi:hypothetical protein
MGIFDEKSKALRSEMLLKDESSSCAWLAERFAPSSRVADSLRHLA